MEAAVGREEVRSTATIDGVERIVCVLCAYAILRLQSCAPRRPEGDTLRRPLSRKLRRSAFPQIGIRKCTVRSCLVLSCRWHFTK
jgi:hypothetical protein